MNHSSERMNDINAFSEETIDAAKKMLVNYKASGAKHTLQRPIVDRDTYEIILLHCQRTGDDPSAVAFDLQAGLRRIRVGKCYETWIETLNLETGEKE